MPDFITIITLNLSDNAPVSHNMSFLMAPIAINFAFFLTSLLYTKLLQIHTPSRMGPMPTCILASALCSLTHMDIARMHHGVLHKTIIIINISVFKMDVRAFQWNQITKMMKTVFDPSVLKHKRVMGMLSRVTKS